jgi:methylglutaconyl-CoA hydratase
VQDLIAAGPEAVSAAKALIANVWGRPLEEAMPVSAAAIASRRVSAEGQEGLRAFLEKRPASWSERVVDTKGTKE